jgi:hypothetical protein
VRYRYILSHRNLYIRSAAPGGPLTNWQGQQPGESGGQEVSRPPQEGDFWRIFQRRHRRGREPARCCLAMWRRRLLQRSPAGAGCQLSVVQVKINYSFLSKKQTLCLIKHFLQSRINYMGAGFAVPV